MTAYEMIQELAQYPADTQIVLAHDWTEPVVDDTYLVLTHPEVPALALHSRVAVELGTNVAGSRS